MTNEWQEFLDYTGTPVYKADSKKDTTYLGRMLIDIFAEFKGLERILTIIARGYLFHEPDGHLKDGDPYDRIDHAINALKAWCSIPDIEKKSDPSVNFSELNSSYPELVDSTGAGWFFRHNKNVLSFIDEHYEQVKKDAVDKAAKISVSFTNDWKNKIRQLQVPIFAPNTNGSWTLRFDDIVAKALDSGPLRMEEYELPEETKAYIDSIDLNGVPKNVIEDIVSFYMANKQPDTDWVVFPVTNFNYYYGNTMLEKKYLKKIPKEIIFRDMSKHGVSRIKLLL